MMSNQTVFQLFYSRFSDDFAINYAMHHGTPQIVLLACEN